MTNTANTGGHVIDIEPAFLLTHRAVEFVKVELKGDTSGHDWYHIVRVFRLATQIAESENANREVVELVAALHDVKDFKFTGDDMAGARASHSWLLENGASRELAELVSQNIAGISFKGAGTPTRPLTIEGQCVQDADRLDALGAIGIARVFAYGGAVERPIYDPGVETAHHGSTAAYLAHKGTSINHFYEKLLLLTDRMNTPTGLAIAKRRHEYLQQYLEQFFQEWDGS